MHVLLIVSYYPSPERPVTGIFFHEQATALQKAGHQVGVLVMPRIDVTIHQVRRAGLRSLEPTTRETYFSAFPVYRMHWGWFPRPLPIIVAPLVGMAAKRAFQRYMDAHGRPDIVHAHNVFYAGHVAAEIKRQFGIPAVLTEHSTSYLRGLIIFPGQKAIIRKTLQTVNATFAVGPALADTLRRYAPTTEIEIIGNVVNTDFFQLAPPLHESKPFTLTAVGHLIKRKRFDLLISAFARVFANKHALLNIGGDGPLRQELAHAAEISGVRSQVRFTGRLTREEVRDLIAQSHVIVSSSDVETFGVTLIEAMASGRPVVATRSGGPEAFVDDEMGLLVEPGNVNQLAAALEQIFMQYHTYVPTRIREKCVSRYSEEAYTRRLVTLYRDAMQADSTREP